MEGTHYLMAKQCPRSNPPALISLVAPAYNEEEGLAIFFDRVQAILASIGCPYEIVLVNDGSDDGTWDEMTQLRAKHPTTTIVNLSRNFGKDIALTAGIAHSRGDVVILIDSDLQDPPELIPELLQGWRDGYDMVYAKRTMRNEDTWLKRFTAGMFYNFAARVIKTPIPFNAGDFRLITRRVADALVMLPERHRFMKGLYGWVGYPSKSVPYMRPSRHKGRTKWNYLTLWNFALDGITSFSVSPLKWASYIGITISFFAIVFGVYVLGKTVLYGDPVRGYPSLIITVLFLGGIQLFFMGILGEYLGRVFEETKRRPLYLVESVEWAEASPNHREKSV